MTCTICWIALAVWCVPPTIVFGWFLAALMLGRSIDDI